MRKAILEGIKMDVFAKQPFPMVPGAPQFPGSVCPPGMKLLYWSPVVYNRCDLNLLISYFVLTLLK